MDALVARRRRQDRSSWSFKTECCGAGALDAARPRWSAKLGGRIVTDAAAREAEAIVVACPMCHSNLDLRRGAINAALGARHRAARALHHAGGRAGARPLRRKALGLHRHFVPVAARPGGGLLGADMSRVGVFVCHCGENIARHRRLRARGRGGGPAPRRRARGRLQVHVLRPGAEPAQAGRPRASSLDGVVVAACSPRMHEPTFRRATEEAGLNPYLCEMANLREHCSWVHAKADGHDREGRSTSCGSRSRRSSATGRSRRSACR